MKEFWVYTGLRALLFLASLGIVGGAWAVISGREQVPALWVLVIAFLISGIASMFMLNAQREALARRVQARAAAASANLEERRAAEDVD
ncbi:MAG: DUF4229 domain-containing protein [Nocardioides sp.]